MFPIEWVLLKNIENLKKLKLDKQSLINIKNSYKVYLRDELNQRKQFESKLRSFYQKQNFGDPDIMVKKHISYI